MARVFGIAFPWHSNQDGTGDQPIDCRRSANRASLRLLTAVYGPLLPNAYGSKADAIGGGAAEVRQTAAPCQQLRYGLTEGGTVAIDAPDPLQKSAV